MTSWFLGIGSKEEMQEEDIDLKNYLFYVFTAIAERRQFRKSESARNLYSGHRSVPLQAFTTRHSNRKLSIVMPLSTTFTQYAHKITKFGKNYAK